MRNPNCVCASNHFVFRPGALGSQKVIAFFSEHALLPAPAFPVQLTVYFSLPFTHACAKITKHLGMHELPPHLLRFYLSLLVALSWKWWWGYCRTCLLGKAAMTMFLKEESDGSKVMLMVKTVVVIQLGTQCILQGRMHSASARFYTCSNGTLTENTQRVTYPCKYTSLSSLAIQLATNISFYPHSKPVR